MAFTSGVFFSACTNAERFRHGHDLLIQFVQIDIRQDGADDTALYRAAVGGPKLLFLHVSGIQEFPDQPKETIILDPFPHDLDQHIVVNIVEEPLYISFNKPPCAGEAASDLVQCRMAASSGAKSAGALLKVILIDVFKDHADHFLDQLVIKALYPQGPQLAVLFRDIDSPGWLGLVTFVLQGFNQPVDLG